MFGVPKPLLPSPHGVLIDIMTDRLLGSCVHLFTGTRSGLYGMLSGRLANDRHSVYLANTATMSQTVLMAEKFAGDAPVAFCLLLHISEPTRLGMISYAVFCLKKKKK